MSRLDKYFAAFGRIFVVIAVVALCFQVVAVRLLDRSEDHYWEALRRRRDVMMKFDHTIERAIHHHRYLDSRHLNRLVDRLDDRAEKSLSY